MISVFRVEHRDSRVGVFQTPDPYTQELAKKAGRNPYLKNPGDDGLYLAFLPWFYVFGCSTLNALKRWVFLGGTFDTNEEIVFKLRDKGFVLAEFLIEEGLYQEGASRMQLAFDPSDARDEGLVEYRDMRELLSASPLVFDVGVQFD